MDRRKTRWAKALGFFLVMFLAGVPLSLESQVSQEMGSGEREEEVPSDFVLTRKGQEKRVSSFSTKVESLLETPATHVFLMDVGTGAVLFEKNADVAMYPSSMTKIMTVYGVLDLLKKGQVKAQDQLIVSEKARQAEGSRMFLEVGSTASIEELLKGVVIQSANDASTVLAEGLWGSEALCAEEMTRLAHGLGAKHTVFTNSSGLPDLQHVTTPRDMAMISVALLRDFPEEYGLFSHKDFTYNKIKQGNRNPLLYKNIGADGIKTGYTEKAGYGMVASAVQRGRRLLLVINGLGSMNERAQEAERILTWGFQAFDTILIASKTQPIERIDVAGGQEDTVALVVREDVSVTIPREKKRQLAAKIFHKNPLIAPLDASQPAGKLILTIPGRGDVTYDLYPEYVVEKAGIFKRVSSAVRRLIYGSNVSTSGGRDGKGS